MENRKRRKEGTQQEEVYKDDEPKNAPFVKERKGEKLCP